MVDFWLNGWVERTTNGRVSECKSGVGACCPGLVVVSQSAAELESEVLNRRNF